MDIITAVLPFSFTIPNISPFSTLSISFVPVLLKLLYREYFHQFLVVDLFILPQETDYVKY